MPEEKLILVSGAVDHGTKSITDVLHRYLQPDETIRIEFGFRKLGLRRGYDYFKRIRNFDQPGTTMVFVFQAPVLLGALLSRGLRSRKIGLNDWTAAFPNFPNSWKYLPYNWIYSRAINRLNDFYSYAPRFAEYYARFGARVRECFLPLPFPCSFAQARPCPEEVRLLFIGADYRRKAGDVLLERWQRSHPGNARLSFVCPDPPRIEMHGADFITDAKPKTPRHRQIFEQSDVFLLPSRSDAFGFALLEAMNFGMVAVTTKTTGAWPLVAEAGGLVADTPEQAIDMAMDLCSRPEEVFERRRRCVAWIQAYPHRVQASWQKILGAAWRPPGPEFESSFPEPEIPTGSTPI